MHQVSVLRRISDFCVASWKKIKQPLFLIAGSISSLFGLAGFFGLCCSPLLGGLLALFGISSLAFLFTYDWLFLIFGAIFLLLFALSWKSYPSCPYKKEGKK
ncbi:MAG: hypothetical protein QXT25_04495 [Candidatus Anstonellaceae archaeon]